MPNDPTRDWQGGIDESFTGRFANSPGSLLESYGVTAPAASASVPSFKPASVLEQFGVDVPGSKAATAKAPEGGFYVPWEGRYVATAKEYETALADHLKPTPTPTKMERAAAVASDAGSGLATRGKTAWNALTDTFMGGVNQIGEGINQLKTGQSASGVGNVGMGALGASLGAVLAPISKTISDEATKLTGNPDFGAKAGLMLPGSVGIKAAAKSIPTVNALNTVVEDIAKGGPSAVNNALKTLRSNPSVTPMDLSPVVETKAIGIAKGELSAGQATLFRRAGERAEEAPTLIEQTYNAGLGKTPNVTELLETYKKNAQMVGESLIQPALEKTGPVNLTGIIKGIDEQIGQPALRALRRGRSPSDISPPLTPIQNRLLHLRQELTYRGKEEHLPTRDQYFMDATGAPNATAQDAGVHGVQSRLRVEAENLRKSSSGQDRQIGGILGDVRGRLVDAIDSAGGGTAAKPGEYKQGLASYRSAKDVEDSFYKGSEILSSSKAMENRPEFFTNWLKDASDHDIAAARLGARTIIDNYIGTVRNAARQGAGIPDAPFVEAKIKALFGEKEGNKVLDTLAMEKRKAEVNNNLVRQSVTARAQAGQEAVKPREVKSIMESGREVGNAMLPAIVGELGQAAAFGGAPGVATGLLAGAGLARKGYQVAGRAHDVAVNNRYAEIASSSEPEMRNALIRALEAKQAQLSGSNKPMNALSATARYLIAP